MKVADTVRSFKEVVEGKHDEIPEQAFYMKGSIDDVLETWETDEEGLAYRWRTLSKSTSRRRRSWCCGSRPSRRRFPGKDGYMGILPGHAALLSELGEGTLSITLSGQTESFQDHGRIRRSPRQSRARAGGSGGMKPAALLLLFAMVAGAADDGFANWWRRFQSAVAKGNGTIVTEGAEFPMAWENGHLRKIEASSVIIDRFDFYFTAEIRDAVAKGKPERLSDGTHIVTWKARGNEYSLYFKPRGASFMLAGLSEGPP